MITTSTPVSLSDHNHGDIQWGRFLILSILVFVICAGLGALRLGIFSFWVGVQGMFFGAMIGSIFSMAYPVGSNGPSFSKRLFLLGWMCILYLMGQWIGAAGFIRGASPIFLFQAQIDGAFHEVVFGVSRYSLMTVDEPVKYGAWLAFMALDLLLFAPLALICFGVGLDQTGPARKKSMISWGVAILILAAIAGLAKERRVHNAKAFQDWAEIRTLKCTFQQASFHQDGLLHRADERAHLKSLFDATLARPIQLPELHAYRSLVALRSGNPAAALDDIEIALEQVPSLQRPIVLPAPAVGIRRVPRARFMAELLYLQEHVLLAQGKAAEAATAHEAWSNHCQATSTPLSPLSAFPWQAKVLQTARQD